ncbi:MAG: hypothetical protein QXZ43_03835 [Candidatus Aenigmatarchaeota archaeon]
MKKIIILMLILFISIPYSYQFPYICCKDKNTFQEKCYVDGECCNEKWYPSCYDFEIWSQGGKFTVGVPTLLNIYVRNIGAYDDTYELKYRVISGNAILDFNNVHKLTLSSENTDFFSPTVIINSNNNVVIEFTVTSTTKGTQKSITVTLSADSMYSLPEFMNILILIVVFFSVFIVYRKV